MLKHSYLGALFFCGLGYVIAKTGGHYDPALIFILYSVFCLFAWTQMKRVYPKFNRQIAVWIALCFSVRLYHRPSIPNQNEGYPLKIINLLILGSLVCLFAAAFSDLWKRNKKNISIRLLWIAVIAMMLAYVLVPLAAPNPFIDVFRTISLSVDYLLKGLNPYDQTYPDIYNGLYDYKPAVAYFPGFFYVFAPIKFLMGDIRFALVIAVWLTALFLFKISKCLGRDLETSLWIVICWLCFPVGLYVVGESFLDPLLTFSASFLIWALLQRRYVLAGISLGVLLAMKQYGVLALPIVTFWFLSKGKKGELFKVVGLGLLVFIGLCLPFAITAPKAFYFSTIQQILNQQLRLDSFSLVSILARFFVFQNYGWAVSLISVSVFLWAVIFLLRGKSAILLDLVGVLATVHGWVFFWGKQAFANYYYYFAIYLLIYLVMSVDQSPQVPGERKSPVISDV